MTINTYLTLKQAVENRLGASDQVARIPEFIALAEDRIAQDLRVPAMENSAVLVWKATTDGGTVGGTADVITLTPTTAASSYAFADTYKFTAASNNTTSVTVNVSGLGAKSVKKRYGGLSEARKESLVADDLIAGVEYRIYYDGTDFILVPPGGVPLPNNFLEQRRSYLDLSSGKRLDFFSPQTFWERNAADESGQPDIYTIEGDFVVAAPVPDGTYRGRMLFYRRFSALSGATDTNWLLANARGLLLYGSLMEAYVFLEDGEEAAKYAQLYDQALQNLNAFARKAQYPRGALPTRSQVGVV